MNYLILSYIFIATITWFSRNKIRTTYLETYKEQRKNISISKKERKSRFRQSIFIEKIFFYVLLYSSIISLILILALQTFYLGLEVRPPISSILEFIFALPLYLSQFLFLALIPALVFPKLISNGLYLIFAWCLCMWLTDKIWELVRFWLYSLL